MRTDGCSGAATGVSRFREVLRAPDVRRRIVEYLGCHDPGHSSCQFLGRLHSHDPSRFERHLPEDLAGLLADGGEIARSFADTTFQLLHLDIEYVNFDDPGAAFTDPRRTFALQEPLVAVIEEVLLTFGIRYLHVVTGQGHHFVWKIRKRSAVAKAIGRLDICNTPDLDPVPEPVFSHVGLLMEYLAHRIKPAAAERCEVPVEITARGIGPGIGGVREMLSIDISEYGDPLDCRMLRIPFTIYHKPWASGLIDRLGIGGEVPAFFTLPLHEMSVHELIERRHQPAAILDLARRAATRIPLEETGTGNLLRTYRKSGLAAFHRRFYSRGHPYPSARHRAVTAAAIGRLPPCALHILNHPNDLLLKPAGIQLVTRCLLAQGWHPRHIAGLLAAKFLDPAHDWGVCWDEYDPVTRAGFYVRLFAGEIDQGIDGGVDFNCVSQQEKRFCWDACGCNLGPLHRKLYPPATPNPLPP